MKKLNKKKIVIVFIIMILIILEIIALRSSSAQNIIDLSATVIDNEKRVDNVKTEVSAIKSETGGYYLILPDIIDGKTVNKYIIENKSIVSDGSVPKTEEINQVEDENEEKIENTNENVEENASETVSEITSETNNPENNKTKENESTEDGSILEENPNSTEEPISKEDSIQEEKKDEKIKETSENLDENQINVVEEKLIDTELDNIIEMEPGERLYLTESEVDTLSITLVVEYDIKIEDNLMLYNQTITKQIGEDKIASITGYIPKDAEIVVNELSNDGIEEKINDFMTQGAYVSVVYDIKIAYQGKEYEPEDFDESVKVLISGLDELNTDEKVYTVIHINEDNSVEKILNVTTRENEVEFRTNGFSTYALVINDISAMALDVDTYAVEITGADIWDGESKSSKFAFGQGGVADPYVIASANDLAFLGESVRSGNSYSGKYFILATDIDLGGNRWNPIGNISSSFNGIFDGNGKTIANGVIVPDTNPGNNTKVSYGFFGSIGPGAEIRNIQFSGMQISMTMTGAMSGSMYMGTVAGTQYSGAQINNVIVKNSNITSTGNLYLNSTNAQMFVGGIVGAQLYSSGTESGAGNHTIANVFSDVDISLAVGLNNNTDRIVQFNCGGIVGCMRSSNANWPLNCLYTGTISANSMIGPIMGGVRNNTPATVTKTRGQANLSANANTIWECNDAGNGNMTSYYTGYNAKTSTFSTSVASGTVPVTNRYRISTTTSNQGYLQGVNKGNYVASAASRLGSFNSYFNDDTYLEWEYSGTYSFVNTFDASVTENPQNYYNVVILQEPLPSPTYTYSWSINGVLDTSVTGATLHKNKDIITEYKISVLVSDGKYYDAVNFVIPKFSIYFEFSTSGTSVIANLTGTAITGGDYSTNDFTYQWYSTDVAGDEVIRINGATSLTLTGAVATTDYKIIATYRNDTSFTVEGNYTYGPRTVIYCDYNNGNNNRDGRTPENAVQTLANAYQKITAGYNMSQNVIVLMGTYSTYNNPFYDTKDSTTANYQKNTTITGKYKGIEYNGELYLSYTNSTWSGSRYNFINGDTTFQNLTFYGSNSQAYLYAQGHNLIMGNGIKMTGYSNANTNQGLISTDSNSTNAPAFHLLGGYLQFNRTSLPRNNNTIIIKSGQYGRVMAGGGSGSSDGAGQTTSHDFTGTSGEHYVCNIIVDIQNQTTHSYDYDINLLLGGATAGNMYADVTIDVQSGNIGRLLGGSIGDRTSISNWNYPENDYIGSSTLNISGGSINELYGGSLGRNMNALSNSGGARNLTCDTYYYGIINININGGTIKNNIYGAGAGGVTGYSEKSSDTYKSYGQGIDTTVNINISGGSIEGNIYGGGYGWTEYLTAATVADDGGSLYGDSNIKISGGTITGSIYGAGCGANVTGKSKLAQMEGKATIEITGGTISGAIYGAGMGLTGQAEMAALTGTTEVNISSDLGSTSNVFGGGSYGKTIGDTVVNLNSGTHTAEIYGGGNNATVSKSSTVNIEDGTSGDVYGGGKAAAVATTYVNINGGTTANVYGGGEAADVTGSTNVKLISGTVTTNIFGGSNKSGTVALTNVETTGGKCVYVYGGNNVAGTTTKSNVVINGGTITSTVYGGGLNANTGETFVKLSATRGKVPYVFGGGKSASITSGNGTTIEMNGGDYSYIYGGSDTSGDVTKSTINAFGGSATDLYGGNNAGGVTSDTYLNIGTSEKGNASIKRVFGGGNNALTNTSHVYIIKNRGKIQEAYAGGNSAKVTTPHIELNGGSVGSLFGGSNGAEVTDSTIVDVSVTLTDVDIKSGEADAVYGGNNALGNVNQTQIDVTGGEIVDIFGGNNRGGDVPKTNIYLDGGTTTSVYGGNNLSGTSGDNNIEITTQATVTNVYGGGNLATSNSATTKISGEITGAVFGGGKQAAVNTDTILIVDGATVNNLYGGGDEGVVVRNTYVYIVDSNILENAFAGGNGSAAFVRGNTNIYVCGATTVGNNIFGGGNRAALGINTGTDAATPQGNSQSLVQILGATVGGNVYGGGNFTQVFGSTTTNIGSAAVGSTSVVLGNETKNLVSGSISINGTVFGGGQANETGGEDGKADWDYVGVSNGTTINIVGSGGEQLDIFGSIFGSGNTSITNGDSIVNIRNYGTEDVPKSNVSIQRATEVNLISSAISLTGDYDLLSLRPNVLYSLSRIDSIKLIGGSTLYTGCKAYLVLDFESLISEGGEVQTARIEENGNMTLNTSTPNSLYLQEGNYLVFEDSRSTPSTIRGMTFLGIYSGANNPASSRGMYDSSYNNGDVITNMGTFSENAYVQGLHNSNEALLNTYYGFYTNYNENGIIKKGYVEVTPPEGQYYMWLVGESLDVTKFEFTLTASKFSSLGTKEQVLSGFGTPNTTFSIVGVSLNLTPGINLIPSNEIQPVDPDLNRADTNFALTMTTGNSGWITDGKTMILSGNTSHYSGTSQLIEDNTTTMPSLLFYLNNSENISTEQELGTVTIRLQALIPNNETGKNEVKPIDIIIKIDTSLDQDIYYDGGMTPGEMFRPFTATATNVTSKSTLSAYYMLYMDEFTEDNRFYGVYDSCKRYLVSRDSSNNARVFTAGTSISMIDLVTNKFYVYVVTDQDEASGKYEYLLDDFQVMGTSGGNYYDRTSSVSAYHASETEIYENFIFHVNFLNSTTFTHVDDNLMLELRDTYNNIQVSVLGESRDKLQYSVYDGGDANISLSVDVSPDVIYLGDDFTIGVSSSFGQQTVNSQTIFDTNYFDYSMGIKISFLDRFGNKLGIDNLLGTTLSLNGKIYYPAFDGTVRMKISDNITDVFSNIIVDTKNNTTLPTGTYKIVVESFGSSDGIYFGMEAAAKEEASIKVISATYGIKATTPDEQKIFNIDGGVNQYGSNSINAKVEYKSEFEDPTITVKLLRRNYDSEYSLDYELVDLADYVSTGLTGYAEKEYLVSNPGREEEKTTFALSLKGQGLVTGTYKLTFVLYDGSSYITEVYDYFIIK